MPLAINRAIADGVIPQGDEHRELRRVGCRSIVRFRLISLVSLLLGTLMATGCGYTVGNDFRQDIKTVAGPIFENKTNRRGIEFQRTEAVQKEITKRSRYRLAKGLEADTRLTAQDDPRELQISLMVKVRWEDLRTGTLLAEQEMPLSPDQISLTSQAEFAPEIGQSLATAMDDSLHSLARKIVNLMETPW